jgi:hypothetical protein
MFNAVDHHNTIKKVSFCFDQLGRLCLRMVETMPDGKKLFYYLKDDGSWNQYDPSSNSAEPLSNARFPELASGDPTDVIEA